MSRILIIVSFNGDRHRTIPASEMLRIQHRQLTTLRHSLDKILIVVNETNVQDGAYDAAVALFTDVLRLPNGPQGSYGSWRDAYLANPDHEWYYFLEDDYTFFMDDFDQRMIDMWQPNMTFLAERVDLTGPFGKHMSVSNGMTRGDVLKNVPWQVMDAQGQYNSQVQVGWSRLFGEEIYDITPRYGSPFWIGWGSYNNTAPDSPVLIGPVQML